MISQGNKATPKLHCFSFCFWVELSPSLCLCPQFLLVSGLSWCESVVCVCVCACVGGQGAHVHSCAYLCLLLSSWYFFIKVLFGLTRVSSNSKLSATLLLSAAGTRAAVRMIRNRYNTIHLAAVVSFLSTVTVCQTREQHLKVCLVCLPF